MPKMANQPPNVVRVRLVTSGADPGLGLVLTSRHEPPRTAVRALQDGSEAKRCGLIHPGIELLKCIKLKGGAHPVCTERIEFPFTLLTMIANSAVQLSTRTLFTMPFGS